MLVAPAPLWEPACHMGSHRVTCHPGTKQVAREKRYKLLERCMKIGVN